ncbi:MAG: transaldolase, partial [Victivallaceae bacterium]
MSDNPLKQVGYLGQAIWLDYIRRDLIADGELKRLIDEDGLRGMTSNPAIFEKAVTGSADYDTEISALALKGRTCIEIYDTISLKDVQSAADVFRPLYCESNGADGYVSLEVNPHLAHDTQGTIAEARRLWDALNCPNVFIKVPATLEGLPAIRQLTSEGININVTLIFGLPRYRQVAEAYIAGIEERFRQDKPLRHVSSVASFFLSRIDLMIDPLLENIIKHGGPDAEKAGKLRGQIAIASAKSAYQIYKELFLSEKFKGMTEHGARIQRLLWASTGAKNP